MITREQCHGCRNDFYNAPGNALDGKRCWSAEEAKVIVRYRIGTWTQPTQKGAFTKVRVPNCYHAQGVSFANKLPDFVKPSDLNRANRSRAAAR